MKRFLILFLILCLCGSGCVQTQPAAQIAATTLPVYEFTTRLCSGTGITVTRLVTESVSCLHDYTLQVEQMRAIESADAVILSGAGLEGFLEEALLTASHIIDASTGIELICPEDAGGQEHQHDDHGHHHEADPHIWLSPIHAAVMAQNICSELTALYPQHEDAFRSNLSGLLADLEALDQYAQAQLSDLSCRELITFHDGFAYLAQQYGLHILRAVEEESGSEASAAELIELIQLVEEHDLTAIFTEVNGADAAAQTVSNETGIAIYPLDMGMSGSSYFDAMYHNIDTLKEALG